jgi:hypothetical protein
MIPYFQTITHPLPDVIKRESESIMRKIASESTVAELLAENQVVRYFCFTEDRAYEVRLNGAILARWTEWTKELKTQFTVTLLTSEFYAMYAPFVAIEVGDVMS